MADFKKFYPKLQGNEGGYADHPKDSGGETYGGVARNFWPKWAGWKRVDLAKNALGVLGIPFAQWPKSKVKTLNIALKADTVLQDMKYQFYKTNYWNSLQLDFVDTQLLAEQLCDMGVNAGAMRPAKMIQWIIYNQDVNYKLVIDGDIGPATIAAINALNQKELYRIFVMLRKAFYYFRAGQISQVTEVQRSFFSIQLNLRSKADQAVFLQNWLSRCVPVTLPL